MGKNSYSSEITGSQFFDDCPSAMWIYDPATLKILAVNKAAVEEYGYEEDEFLQLTIRELWHPDDAVNMREAVDRISKEKYYDGGRWRHLKKGGQIFYVHTYSNITSFKGHHARMVLVTNINANIEAERKNEELHNKIEKERKQYQGILSSLTEVVWLCDAATYQLIYSNEASYHVLGYTEAEFFANKNLFFNSVHPEDRAQFFASFEEMFATGRTSVDFRFIHKDGGIRYLSSTTILVKGKNGEPDTYTGSAIDVTHKKLIEDALTEKAKEVEDILESITDAFFAADANWNLTYVNRAAEKMYNVKRENLLNKYVWDIFPKTLNTKFYEEFHRTVREQVSVLVEGISPTSGRWVLANAFPTKTGIAVYFKDISEQKRLQEHINNNIQNLNSLINNTTDLMWSVDRDFKIISANQAFKDVVYKLNKVIIEPRSYALPNELGEEIIKERKGQYSRAFEGEAFMVVDERMIEGDLVYRETSFNPIKDDNGSVLGVSCFSRDITERRKQLITIQAQNEKLKEIAWIQSHKVRGPLATILGLSNIFNSNEVADPSNEKIIKGIKEEAQNLDEIIKEVVRKTYDIDT